MVDISALGVNGNIGNQQIKSVYLLWGPNVYYYLCRVYVGVINK